MGRWDTSRQRRGERISRYEVMESAHQKGGNIEGLIKDGEHSGLSNVWSFLIYFAFNGLNPPVYIPFQSVFFLTSIARQMRCLFCQGRWPFTTNWPGLGSWSLSLSTFLIFILNKRTFCFALSTFCLAMDVFFWIS